MKKIAKIQEYLKDPLVHDNDGNIETPPLKNCEERSNSAPLTQPSLLHLSLASESRSPNDRPQNPDENGKLDLKFEIGNSKLSAVGLRPKKNDLRGRS